MNDDELLAQPGMHQVLTFIWKGAPREPWSRGYQGIHQFDFMFHFEHLCKAFDLAIEHGLARVELNEDREPYLWATRKTEQAIRRYGYAPWLIVSAPREVPSDGNCDHKINLENGRHSQSSSHLGLTVDRNRYEIVRPETGSGTLKLQGIEWVVFLAAFEGRERGATPQQIERRFPAKKLKRRSILRAKERLNAKFEKSGLDIRFAPGAGATLIDAIPPEIELPLVRSQGT